MLSHIFIRDLALIESLDVDLGDGLNIVTGETGAGKSIVIGALQLVLGQRAAKGLIRTGAGACEVTAVFQLSSEQPCTQQVNRTLARAGAPECDDGQLLLRRIITSSASRCFANSAPVTLDVLKKIGAELVDIHGPYDHQSLLKPARQLEMLDRFGGNTAAVEDCAKLHGEWRAALARLENADDEAPTPDRIDILTFQRNEIRDAALQAGEDVEMSERHALAANAAELLRICDDSCRVLDDGDEAVTDSLAEVMRQLHDLRRVDPKTATAFIERLEQIVEYIHSLTGDMRDYGSGAAVDPAELDRLDRRITLIQKLKRKYGGSLGSIEAYALDAAATLERAENYDRYRDELQAAVEAAEKAFLEQATVVSRRRRKALRRLAPAVSAKLQELGFENAAFAVELEQSRASASGVDSVEFHFTPNSGEGSRSLRAVASSGEICRIMLAIKTVLAASDDIPVLIFDEIDANIGGVVASRVGQEMRKLGKTRQTICISHLPQVAAAATRHFSVEKRTRKKRTSAVMRMLDDEQRVKEVARMLGGVQSSTVVMEHARELIGRAMV
jgi:DNA repair protein RecN (Recombination protein N)